MLFAADTEEEVKSFRTYIYTKVARFLLLQCVVSQDVTREKYRFVPALKEYSGVYDDAKLCKIWGLSDEDWALIDSKIATVTENGFNSES